MGLRFYWFVAGNHFNESDFDITAGEAKYQSFDEIAVSEILVVDVEISFKSKRNSLQDIFLNTPQSTDPVLLIFSIVDSSVVSISDYYTMVYELMQSTRFLIICYSGNGCAQTVLGVRDSHLSQTSDCSIGLGLKTTGYQGGSVGGTTFGDFTQILDTIFFILILNFSVKDSVSMFGYVA